MPSASGPPRHWQAPPPEQGTGWVRIVAIAATDEVIARGDPSTDCGGYGPIDPPSRASAGTDEGAGVGRSTIAPTATATIAAPAH